MVFGFNYSDNACATNIYVENIDLKGWVIVDGFTKIIAILLIIAMNILYRMYEEREKVIYFLGTSLKIYYFFLLCWMSLGSYMFFANSYVLGDCPNEFGNYIWALHMTNNVVMPVGFIISGFSGTKYQEILI